MTKEEKDIKWFANQIDKSLVEAIKVGIKEEKRKIKEKKERRNKIINELLYGNTQF